MAETRKQKSHLTDGGVNRPEKNSKVNMLKPLDDPLQTVQLIAAVCETHPREVHQRLLVEAKEIGTNVFTQMQEQKIPLHIPSDLLDNFYRNSDAFVYETTVWNACRAKQQMQDFILNQLHRLGRTNARIFCFGDGLGFDSAWLALQGHQVSYFEPSLRCQQYAQAVFESNGVNVQFLSGLQDLPEHGLDVIVCLDVLEHVPNPAALVAKFADWLKPDGLLIVHAPFWCIHWTRSTHLKQNRTYSGDTRRLYRNQGFRPVDASIFWDPIIFERSDLSPGHPITFTGRLRLLLGKLLLLPGRLDDTVHTWIARQIARPSGSWVQRLQELDLPPG